MATIPQVIPCLLPSKDPIRSSSVVDAPGGGMVSEGDRCRTKTEVKREISLFSSCVIWGYRYGDLDLGFVGYDMFCELAEEDPDLVLIHEALEFGKCRLSLGVPFSGIYASVTSLDVSLAFLTLPNTDHHLQDLKNMDLWSETRPMRVVTGYANIARRFFTDHGFEHVVLLTGDGALEAGPAMGSADIILDLVSTGVTLRENNLREIEGGEVCPCITYMVVSQLLCRFLIVRASSWAIDEHCSRDMVCSVSSVSCWIGSMHISKPKDISPSLQT